MKYLLLLLLAGIMGTVSGQEKKAASLELSLWGRRDLHGDYPSRYGNRSYTNRTQLLGMSYGTSLALHLPFLKYLYVQPAAGYYQLRVGKLRQSTPFGTATARNFDNEWDSTALLHGTGRYHYKNLMLGLEVGAAFPIRRSGTFTVSADYQCYLTFAQVYQETGMHQPPYKTRQERMLGSAVNAYAGWKKEFKRHYIHPRVIVPLYQVLHSDPVFKEDPALRIIKRFQGAGISIGIGKYFR